MVIPLMDDFLKKLSVRIRDFKKFSLHNTTNFKAEQTRPRPKDASRGPTPRTSMIKARKCGLKAKA